MDRRQIAMKLVVEALGIEFNISTFNDRLILHKAIYLAQAGGVDLGYHYRWYLRGPYSPTLTRDAYAVDLELVGGGEDDSKGWVLHDTWREKLNGLSSLLAADTKADRADRAELLASVHFLVATKQIAEREPGKIRDRLEEFGKDFAEEEVASALRGLKEHDLLC